MEVSVESFGQFTRYVDPAITMSNSAGDHPARRSLAFEILAVGCVLSFFVGTSAEFYNCKTKVRDIALKYCSGDDLDLIRTKRDADTPPSSLSAILRPGTRRSNDAEGSGDVRTYRRNDFAVPGFRSFGFPVPASGDDLGMELSEADVEELYKEISSRLSRAAKNKDDAIRMINAFAAKCCNENLQDDCDDVANIITCP